MVLRRRNTNSRNVETTTEMPITLEIPSNTEKSTVCQLAIDFINFLLYQRQQIPEPVQLLLRDYAEKDVDSENKTTARAKLSKTRQQATIRKQVLKFLENLSNLQKSLSDIFSSKDLVQVDLLLGATPTSPKEIFSLNLLHFVTDEECVPVSSRHSTLCSRKLCMTLLSQDEFFVNSPTLSNIHVMVKMRKADSAVPGWQPWPQYRPRSDRIKLKITIIPVGINHEAEENKENLTSKTQEHQPKLAKNDNPLSNKGEHQPLKESLNVNNYKVDKDSQHEFHYSSMKNTKENCHKNDLFAETKLSQSKLAQKSNSSIHVLLSEWDTNQEQSYKQSKNMSTNKIKASMESVGLSEGLQTPTGKSITETESRAYTEHDLSLQETNSVLSNQDVSFESFSNLLGGEALGNISLDSTGTEAELDRIFETAASHEIKLQRGNIITESGKKFFGPKNVKPIVTLSSNQCESGNVGAKAMSHHSNSVHSSQLADENYAVYSSTFIRSKKTSPVRTKNDGPPNSSPIDVSSENTAKGPLLEKSKIDDDFVNDSFACDNYDHADMELIDCEQSFIIFGEEENSMSTDDQVNGSRSVNVVANSSLNVVDTNSESNEDEQNYKKELGDSNPKLNVVNSMSTDDQVKDCGHSVNVVEHSNAISSLNVVDTQSECNEYTPDCEMKIIRLRRLSKGEPVIKAIDQSVKQGVSETGQSNSVNVEKNSNLDSSLNVDGTLLERYNDREEHQTELRSLSKSNAIIKLRRISKGEPVVGTVNQRVERSFSEPVSDEECELSVEFGSFPEGSTSSQDNAVTCGNKLKKLQCRNLLETTSAKQSLESGTKIQQNGTAVESLKNEEDLDFEKETEQTISSDMRSLKLRRLSKGEPDSNTNLDEQPCSPSLVKCEELSKDTKSKLSENITGHICTFLDGKSPESGNNKKVLEASNDQKDQISEYSAILDNGDEVKINLRRLSAGEIKFQKNVANFVSPHKTEYLDIADNDSAGCMKSCDFITEKFVTLPLLEVVSNEGITSCVLSSVGNNRRTSASQTAVPQAKSSLCAASEKIEVEEQVTCAFANTIESEKASQLTMDEDTLTEPPSLLEITKVKLRDLAVYNDKHCQDLSASEKIAETEINTENRLIQHQTDAAESELVENKLAAPLNNNVARESGQWNRELVKNRAQKACTIVYGELPSGALISSKSLNLFNGSDINKESGEECSTVSNNSNEVLHTSKFLSKDQFVTHTTVTISENSAKSHVVNVHKKSTEICTKIKTEANIINEDDFVWFKSTIVLKGFKY
ncbi:uncharacterized protein LOC120344436 [Styela clava]